MQHPLQDLLRRYQDKPTDEWFRQRMSFDDSKKLPSDADPELLLRTLHENLETAIYVPIEEGVRIARWIYEKSRGFGAHRFSSIERYVDVSMARECDISNYCDPELVPIYLIDGLPGYGKSALVRALRRVQPPSGESLAEGDPPQRIPTLSTLWVKVNKNFSMNTFARDALMGLGVEPPSKSKTFLPLAQLLFKTLYRMGGTCLVVDELQFASGRESIERALSQLLAMRDFGVPIFAFTNTDFIIQARNSPGQIAQRLTFMQQTLRPVPRGHRDFVEVSKAQLNLFPFGSNVDVENCALDLYDMVAGSQRGLARLIEVAAESIIREQRPLCMLDLVNARRTQAFQIFNEHTALLTTIYPVDAKKHPEFTSNNDQCDAGALIRQQLDEQRMADAAAVALYASYNKEERQGSQAATVKIMRDAGKIPPNIAAIGEAKTRRKPKTKVEDSIAGSFAAKHLAKHTIPVRPGHDDKDAGKQ